MEKAKQKFEDALELFPKNLSLRSNFIHQGFHATKFTLGLFRYLKLAVHDKL